MQPEAMLSRIALSMAPSLRLTDSAPRWYSAGMAEKGTGPLKLTRRSTASDDTRRRSATA